MKNREKELAIIAASIFMTIALAIGTIIRKLEASYLHEGSLTLINSLNCSTIQW